MDEETVRAVLVEDADGVKTVTITTEDVVADDMRSYRCANAILNLTGWNVDLCDGVTLASAGELAFDDDASDMPIAASLPVEGNDAAFVDVYERLPPHVRAPVPPFEKPHCYVLLTHKAAETLRRWPRLNPYAARHTKNAAKRAQVLTLAFGGKLEQHAMFI